MSTGFRNKNPLNVKQGRVPWRGQVGVDERNHAVFKSQSFGWRAAIRLLRTYYLTHGLQTVLDIISRWAPATDTIGSLPGAPQNDPRSYAKFVANRVGVGINDRLLLFEKSGQIRNGQQLRGLLREMCIYECGHSFPFDAAELEAGVRLYKSEFSKSDPPSDDEVPVSAPEPQPSLWTRIRSWFSKRRRSRSPWQFRP